jgi:hypothetical protein
MNFAAKFPAFKLLSMTESESNVLVLFHQLLAAAPLVLQLCLAIPPLAILFRRPNTVIELLFHDILLLLFAAITSIAFC